MSEQHISRGIDADLRLLSTKLLEMGGLVESQIANTLGLLKAFDSKVVDEMLESERRLNRMELEIDEMVSSIIARRQPIARDLRLLMAISKCVTILERAGDETRKVAKRLRRIHHENYGDPSVAIAEIRASGEMALGILRRALDAFARMDTVAAARIVWDDDAIDDAFRAVTRDLVTKMTEDSQAILNGLKYMFIAKAIERIGDHATNIAELVVYVVKGVDVRHVPREQLEHEALK